MIRYHYNFYVDFKQQLKTLRDLRWLKENKIVVFYPNPWKTLKLIFKRPVVKYQCEEDIDCYWVSGGNGGSYYPPSEIRVCPRGMDQAFIERTVRHEITHLKYDKDVQGMSHQEKEAYIITKDTLDKSLEKQPNPPVVQE